MLCVLSVSAVTWPSIGTVTRALARCETGESLARGDKRYAISDLELDDLWREARQAGLHQAYGIAEIIQR